MDIEQLQDYCDNKPDSEATLPFGPETLVYKVRGKAFILIPLEKQPLQFNVKCDPEKAIELRERYPCVLPGYHMNKKHWNTVIVDGSISSQQLKEFVDDSYALVAAPAKKAS